jgi:ribosome-binding factor A
MHHREQVTAAIHREVAAILKRYIEDPRLQNIVVTTVKLSKKLDYATIGVTQLEKRFTQIETLKSLQKATSKIRYYLARQRTHAHRTPKLRFHYDHLLAQGTQLYQLIDKAVSLH